jgi:cytidylate kinase
VIQPTLISVLKELSVRAAMRSAALFRTFSLSYTCSGLSANPSSNSTHQERPAPAGLIAIDGPVASGKTAVGLALAREWGYRLVDTGMMYRALTYLALKNGIDLEDEAALEVLARTAQFDLGQPTADEIATVTAEGEDITGKLRTPEVDRAVSTVSRIAGVRRAMVQRQRALAGEGKIIMLGRDIGTVVLPDAPVKVYLDASAQERARRRYLETKENGNERPLREIQEELKRRDEMDRNRHSSPLRPADDAVIIETDDLPLERVIERVRDIALQRR